MCNLLSGVVCPMASESATVMLPVAVTFAGEMSPVVPADSNCWIRLTLLAKSPLTVVMRVLLSVNEDVKELMSVSIVFMLWSRLPMLLLSADMRVTLLVKSVCSVLTSACTLPKSVSIVMML